MAKKKTYKMPPPAENEVSEPAIAYGEMNILKQELIDDIKQQSPSHSEKEGRPQAQEGQIQGLRPPPKESGRERNYR